ncbi:hypothetical protein MKW94_013755 [Papaver nudicaule]|uniref:Uncharacterized protein n=1 Tax=Papaver nudicaule TaxID=74823 RepID=A0AA41SGW7_PAPNU|nr:hypothetical protein [Papaver nudicaule]
MQNLQREKHDLIKRDSVDLNYSENDVSDNDEESNNTNKCEEIQSETENRSDEIIYKPRNISEGIPHEASVDLDGSGSEDDLPSNNRVERPLSGQEYDTHLISCKKELQLNSTPKRKWAADLGTSEFRTEDAEKMKKFNAGQNVFLECFSMEVQTPSVYSQSQSIEEKMGQDERASHGERMTISHIEKLGNTTFVGEKENVVKEVSLNGKGDNFGDSNVMVIRDKEPKWRSQSISAFQKVVCVLFTLSYSNCFIIWSENHFMFDCAISLSTWGLTRLAHPGIA